MAFIKVTNTSYNKPSKQLGVTTISEIERTKKIESYTISSSNLTEIAMHLLKKTDEGLAAIEELKGTMEQIAAAAEENAGASEESLSAIEEIQKKSIELQNDSEIILEISSKFQELLKEVNQSIIEDKVKMELTADMADAISQNSLELYEDSKRINDAVNLITHLAKKTSLLALNAAIEAARAKEGGKSFTIMATEIRQIASKSNDYVKNIKNIVADTQEKINVTKKKMDELKSEITNAEEITQESSEKMEKIVETVNRSISTVNEVVSSIKTSENEIKKLLEHAEVIASAAEESASAVSEVTNTISMQVDAFSQAQEAATMIKNLAAKNDESTREELAAAAEELSSTNEELEKSMEQVLEALSQIEEAAHISKNDALKANTIAAKSLEYVRNSKNNLQNLYEMTNIIDKDFDDIIQALKKIQNLSLHNTQKSEEVVPELNFVVSKINSLNNMIRKIELAIVQISALSINGSVEAIRAGELGTGFSEVSKDIKELANTSESNLDSVIEIIDTVKEKNDQINVLVNNIILTQKSENEKLARIEYELQKNKDNLTKVLIAVDNSTNLVEQIFKAAEESKIASEQIQEAADLAYKNAVESREAAKIILSISKEMNLLAHKLSQIANA